MIPNIYLQICVRYVIVNILFSIINIRGLGCKTYCLGNDGYYVAYKSITLSYISSMFIKMKFIHCHSCVTFLMKSMSI